MAIGYQRPLFNSRALRPGGAGTVAPRKPSLGFGSSTVHPPAPGKLQLGGLSTAKLPKIASVPSPPKPPTPGGPKLGTV